RPLGGCEVTRTRASAVYCGGTEYQVTAATTAPATRPRIRAETQRRRRAWSKAFSAEAGGTGAGDDIPWPLSMTGIRLGSGREGTGWGMDLDLLASTGNMVVLRSEA